MEKQDRVAYDVVLMLQPTSPYRNPREILGVVQKLVEENLDSVVTVSEAPLTFHPFKQFKKVGQYLKYVCEEGESVIARQQLFPTYFRNGIAYAVTRDCLRTQKKIIGEKAGAFLTDHPFVNIDSLDDFALGESMTAPSVTSDT